MCSAMKKPKHEIGFTLIELSIVLVIIGLVVGGVLVGQDLIKSAEVRAQISQIEKFNTAVNTFQGKYGYLPGDIPDPYATQFGFQARGYNSQFPPPNAGMGDGDGMIAGGINAALYGWIQGGEPVAVWSDLSTAKLIEGNYIGDPANWYSSDASLSNGSLSKFIPVAKIGNNTSVYTLSAFNKSVGYNLDPYFASNNFFSVSAVSLIAFRSKAVPCGSYASCAGDSNTISNTGIPVTQAYAVDKKIDDGLPTHGNVRAVTALNGGIYYANGDVNLSWSGGALPDQNAIAASSTTCYDNNNVSGKITNYSISQNNGNGTNCALSFKFQ